MANSDDKPTLKITLEDLAAVELPAQAPAGNPGDFMSVPRFAPKWLPDQGSNLGPAD